MPDHNQKSSGIVPEKKNKITVANSTEIENASDSEFLSDQKTKGFLLLTTMVFLYF